MCATECGLDCHKKCEKFIPNLCGVNQKILAEMLDDLKLSNKVVLKKLVDCCSHSLLGHESFSPIHTPFLIIRPSLMDRIKHCTPSVRLSVPSFLEVGKPLELLV